MTGFELDALEQGERVALELKPAACSCRWFRKASGRTRWVPCADHTPEPADLSALAALQRSLERRG